MEYSTDNKTFICIGQIQNWDKQGGHETLGGDKTFICL